MKKYAKTLIYTFLTWFLLHSLLIVVDGLWDEVQQHTVVVILGNKVHEDGSLSARLQSRMDKGLELYNNGICRQIVVSGGLGKEGLICIYCFRLASLLDFRR